MNLIIYRGPLERARLAFTFEALIESESEDFYFIWISPLALDEKNMKRSNKFLTEYGFKETLILEQSYKNLFSTKKAISKLIKDSEINLLVLIGFTSLEFGSGIKANKKIWFVNGIPEERNLGNNSLFTHRVVDMMWFFKKFFIKDLDLIITVSERMKNLMNSRLKGRKIFAAPTCVDTKIFKGNKPDKKYDFCYIGSGAQWQALDLLSEVWSHIHRLDPELNFRVISRDERTKVLGNGIDEKRINFVSSDNFEEVANYLAECEAGFLLRRDHIVNQVSFPTKLAEYLASGCWVISTDMNWDISDYFRKFNIGVLISPKEEPLVMAKKILEFRKNLDINNLQINKCVQVLDRGYWKELIQQEIIKI